MAEQHNYTSDLVDLLASFTDNGRSLRSFVNHPQELSICILTAGLLANNKLMMNPEDAVKASFDIYARIQKHVGNYQSLTFAATVEDAFRPHPEWGERPPEIEQD
jgi:hypothetical protein